MAGSLIGGGRAVPHGANDRFRDVIDNMSEGFVLVDRDFIVMEMNREGERIEGRPASDFVGKSLWESWPDLEFAELGLIWKRAIDEQRPVELDHVYQAQDGRRMWLEMRAHPTSGGLAIFYRDVTPKREAEAELLETKRRLDAVLDNASVAIFLMNEHGHCAYVNAAAETLTGYTLAELRGRPLHEVIRRQNPGHAERWIEFPMGGDDHRQGEDVLIHKDGHEYAIAFTVSPIHDEGSKTIGTIVEVRDIGGEKAAAAALHRTQAELVHMSRVNAMGTMAATIAHELNQPLTAIGNYIRGSRRIIATGGDLARVMDALGHAERGAQQAGEIVRRVRSFVATGTVKASAQDLPRLVEQACVLALVDQQVRGITHSFHFDPWAHWVAADPIQVQQVIINLIRNAVEAMEQSAVRHVDVSTSRLANDMVEIVISDTGPGIPDDLREELFSPFHSTKTEGVGVGLSICRTIVEAHHGTIRADRREEGGTAFRFTLPAAAAPEGP